MEDRENAHLEERNVKILKNCLLVEKEKILQDVKKDRISEMLQNAETKDSVDDANEHILMSFTTRLNNRQNLYLKKVLKALDRLEKGTYGICFECGYEIPFERLQARLTSEMCIVCKEESEQAEQHNFFGRKSKSLGRGMVSAR